MYKNIFLCLFLLLLLNCDNDDNEVEVIIELPTVTTINVTDITASVANGGGEVIDTGGSSILEQGVCWSTSPNPTLEDSFTIDGNETGAFSCALTGLNQGEIYYVRAYATNTIGTAYGNEIEFNTNLPTITTLDVTDITPSTAISGGEVTDEGGSNIIQRGVCWSTSPNPTLENSFTSDGTETGVFSSTLNGLTEDTEYYLRAYATNSIGTTYGNEIQFNNVGICYNNTTGSGVTLLTQQDVDNFNYASVGALQIGDINGNLSDINDLSALSCLTNIDTQFYIWNNPNLQSLNGLNNLNTIGMHFEIKNNSSLVSIDDFDSLTTVGGNITYWEDFTVSMRIEDNISLLDIDIPNLTSAGSVSISNCESLTTIECPSIEGLFGLSISGNPQIVSLNFSSLESVGATGVTGENFGVFTISDTQLTSLDTFNNLTSGALAYFSINGNNLLQNFNGISNFNVGSESISIVDNNLITSLQGISLYSINETFVTISNNDLLIDIDNVNSFFSSIYLVDISNNNSLSDLSSLTSLQYCVIGGVIVDGNNSLSDLCNLTNYANAVNNATGSEPCSLIITNNAYNPTTQEIVNGNCSQ